jgi:hypothetical protein
MESSIRTTARSLLQSLHLTPDELASTSETVRKTDITTPDQLIVPTPFKVSELISALNVAVLALANEISVARLGRTQGTACCASLSTAGMTSHFTYTLVDRPCSFVCSPSQS